MTTRGVPTRFDH